MGVDTVVDLDCEPKRALGIEAIVQLLKDRDRANMVLGPARAAGDNRPPEQITFRVVLQRPTGPEESDVSVADLMRRANALAPHVGHCRSCIANAGSQEGYGCVGYLSYPIRAETERWLWSRLPASLDTTAGRFLQRAIEDFGWDGAQAAAMRRGSDTFFESKTALVGSYPGGFTLTSDQVFHMLFHVGHLGDTHAFMVALFFGLVPHDIDPGILSDANRRAQVLAFANVPPMQGQLEEMAAFLRSCASAARFGVELLVDG